MGDLESGSETGYKARMITKPTVDLNCKDAKK
jgi:hypothetical protein